MENTLCRILCQYHDENGKPKGMQEFNLMVDSDTFLWAPPELIINSLQRMVDAEWSTKRFAGKCTYVDHELIFSPPLVIVGSLGETMQELWESGDYE